MSMERIEDHFQEEVYGAAYKFSPEIVELYGRVLLMIAAGDGVVSDIEWRFFVGRAKAMGIPDQMIEKWKFDYTKGDLEGDVKRFWELHGNQRAYSFLYDAIKLASADGYADGEKLALRKAAKVCGVSESIVLQLENLVAMEAAVRELRITLLYPEGSPFHDPEEHHQHV